LEPGRCLSDRQITGYMPPERQTVAEELRSEYTLGYVSNNALQSCLEEVERLSRLTEELLVLADLDAERETGAGAPAVPLSIVDDALRRLEVPAARRAVKLVLESGPEPLAVRANPGAVSLALRNVLDNAVKFSPPGGQVTIGVRPEGSEALVLVSDAGPGVSADELSRLFDRFHRAPPRVRQTRRASASGSRSPARPSSVREVASGRRTALEVGRRSAFTSPWPADHRSSSPVARLSSGFLKVPSGHSVPACRSRGSRRKAYD
jgi:hypothetical protein